jgi:hypothetical protein
MTSLTQFQNFIRNPSVLGPEETAYGLSLTGTHPAKIRQTGGHLGALNEMPPLLPHQERTTTVHEFLNTAFFQDHPVLIFIALGLACIAYTPWTTFLELLRKYL